VFTINATIQQANTVFLGYRFQPHEAFTKISMYDDGQHNDGAANDGVYGVSVTMSQARLQYYIYAENNNAGMFSPERAEHEFHTLSVPSQSPTLGQLVINEVLADNTTGPKDEYNDREDWIEVYNTSTNVLDLSQVYLSDDSHNILKWKFPNNTYLEPNGFMIVWADDEAYQLPRHTSFNMNKLGDTVLLSLGNNTLLDSTTFGAQLSNVSWGRFPNGTGSFQPMNTSYNTYNNNWPLQVTERTKNPIYIYPNPTTNTLNILCQGEQELRVFDAVGKQIWQQNIKGNTQLNTSQWPNGVYWLQCGEHTKQFAVLH
jgi:hypothetical protein